MATELSKLSVAAAEFNLAANDIANVSIGRLSAEDFTAAWHGRLESKRAKALNLKEHDLRTILVDPPRAGAKECRPPTGSPYQGPFTRKRTLMHVSRRPRMFTWSAAARQ